MTSSAEASLVSRSVPPGGEEARMTTVISGRRCCASLPKFSPVTSLARMLLESSQWWSSRGITLEWKIKKTYSERVVELRCEEADTPSKESAETSRRRDILSSRLLFQLAPLTLRTGATGCGFLRNGKASPLLKTPSAMDGTVVSGKAAPKAGDSGTLAQEMMSGFCRLLPTPLARGGAHPNTEWRGANSMVHEEQQKILSGKLCTPTASIAKGGAMRKDPKKQDASLKDQVHARCAPEGSRSSLLNPLFVSEMMGFPLEWLTLPFLGGEDGRGKP